MIQSSKVFQLVQQLPSHDKTSQIDRGEEDNERQLQMFSCDLLRKLDGYVRLWFRERLARLVVCRIGLVTLICFFSSLSIPPQVATRLHSKFKNLQKSFTRIRERANEPQHPPSFAPTLGEILPPLPSAHTVSCRAQHEELKD